MNNMHTLSGKITRAPKIQAGSNSKGPFTGFYFEISEFVKGYGQEQDSYTNYSVEFFPSSQAAIDFHMRAIAEGSFVVVSCEKLKLDVSNAQYPKAKMVNARLEGFLNPNEGGQQQQSAPQQQQAPAYQQAPAQQAAPQMAPAYQQPAPQQAPQQQQQPQQQAAPQSWGNAPQNAPAQRPAQQPPTPNNPATGQAPFDPDIPF